jgi:hypothetical protein
MTTTTKINGTIRTFTMAETESGPHYAAHLIANGFDGKVYLGTSPRDGRKREVQALFLRRASGEFVSML